MHTHLHIYLHVQSLLRPINTSFSCSYSQQIVLKLHVTIQKIVLSSFNSSIHLPKRHMLDCIRRVVCGQLHVKHSLAHPAGLVYTRQVSTGPSRRNRSWTESAVSSQGYQSHSRRLLRKVSIKRSFTQSKHLSFNLPKNGEEECLKGLRIGYSSPKTKQIILEIGLTWASAWI